MSQWFLIIWVGGGRVLLNVVTMWMRFISTFYLSFRVSYLGVEIDLVVWFFGWCMRISPSWKLLIKFLVMFFISCCLCRFFLFWSLDSTKACLWNVWGEKNCNGENFVCLSGLSVMLVVVVWFCWCVLECLKKPVSVEIFQGQIWPKGASYLGLVWILFSFFSPPLYMINVLSMYHE